MLDAGCHEGAYYLTGYAVECALKACIARKTQQHDFPDRKLVSQVFTHNLSSLVRAAGLESDLIGEIRSHPDFSDNWEVTKLWAEESRYDPNISAQAAQDLYNAVADPTAGVLAWLKKYW